MALPTRISDANLRDGAVRGRRQTVWGTALSGYPFRALRASIGYQLGQVALDGPNRRFPSIGFRLSIEL